MLTYNKLSGYIAMWYRRCMIKSGVHAIQCSRAVFYIVVKIITKTYLGNNKKEF